MIRKTYFIILSVVSGLYGASQDDHSPTWQKMLASCREADDELKQGMKEQLLSDFVYAGCDPARSQEARMFAEVISRRMNGNKRECLSKPKLGELLQAFRSGDEHAVGDAERARDAITIIDPELAGTKDILKAVPFTPDIDGALLRSVVELAPDCKGIFTEDATPESLEQRVQEGSLTEEQIVTAVHRQMLVKLLAFVLLTERSKG